MWSFQITYMIPIRRASAWVLPSASVAKMSLSIALATWRSAFEVASSVQSIARPSLCSDAPPPQARPVAPPPPPYVATRYSPSRTVPLRGLGWQVACAWYDA